MPRRLTSTLIYRIVDGNNLDEEESPEYIELTEKEKEFLIHYIEEKSHQLNIQIEIKEITNFITLYMVWDKGTNVKEKVHAIENTILYDFKTMKYEDMRSITLHPRYSSCCLEDEEEEILITYLMKFKMNIENKNAVLDLIFQYIIISSSNSSGHKETIYSRPICNKKNNTIEFSLINTSNSEATKLIEKISKEHLTFKSTNTTSMRFRLIDNSGDKIEKIKDENILIRRIKNTTNIDGVKLIDILIIGNEILVEFKLENMRIEKYTVDKERLLDSIVYNMNNEVYDKQNIKFVLKSTTYS